jgi:hypothetical protein
METANERTLEQIRTLPAPYSCRLIEFEKAEVRPGIVNGTWFLVVTGSAPCSNMRVDLVPLVYIRRPEYWEIEVIGCLPGPFCLPQTKPFVETLPLNGVLGSKGIEVAGAARRQRIDVP